MEDQWKGKNVDLSILSDRIVQFFAENGFDAHVNKLNNGYGIIARPREFQNLAENISVHVEGQPDNFSVKFIAGSHSRSLVTFGILTQLLGGGSFALKGLKSKEALEELENKFWVYIDKKVEKLTNSSHLEQAK